MVPTAVDTMSNRCLVSFINAGLVHNVEGVDSILSRLNVNSCSESTKLMTRNIQASGYTYVFPHCGECRLGRLLLAFWQV